MIQSLYEEFYDTELMYNQTVVHALGFLVSDASITIHAKPYPCALHSISFQDAKVLVRVPESVFIGMSEIRGRNAQLNLSFFNRGDNWRDDFTFSGTFAVIQNQLVNNGDLALLLSLKFEHRLSDDFVVLQGTYLNLMKDTQQRGEERIPINDETQLTLGLSTAKAALTIDKIEISCLVRELSYQGARVLLSGLAPSAVKGPCELTLNFTKEGKLHLLGSIIRAEEVPGRKDLALLGIQFTQDQVRVEYLHNIQKGLKHCKTIM